MTQINTSAEPIWWVWPVGLSLPPLVLSVSYLHHNFCFFQELFLSLNRYLPPTSMAFLGPVVFLKDIQERHSFLKEYERGHIQEGFLELSKWSQGKHQENLFVIAQLLNCQRLLFGNTHECKSNSKALNFTTIVVMTSVFQSTNAKQNLQVHLVTASVCQSQHIQEDGRYVLLGRKHKTFHCI